MKISNENARTSIFQTFLNQRNYYKPAEIDVVFDLIKPYLQIGNGKIEYYNIPVAFDIETTSFYESGEKHAIMYEWSFAIFGVCIIGRTWEEFATMLKSLAEKLGLTVKKRRLLIYVHNLAFEFQFFRKWLDVIKVFAIETRKPIYAITLDGFEFRCSYLLSGYSLEKLGENLQHYDIKKLTGDLDYELKRHSNTPLTQTELDYCINDVKVLNAYVMELIEQYGDLSALPLTKTGFVREYCRKECYDNDYIPYSRLHYRDLMRTLTLDPDEYKQLKRAFQGGFTHCNPFYSGKVVYDVTSYDFTSSYPFVMVSEQFPMGRGELVHIESNEELEKNLKLYCCLFDIEIFDLEPLVYYDNYLSISRCWNVDTPVINNGRLVSAKHICTTVTETDYKIIRKFYTWKTIRIANFRRYRKDYLPTEFIKAILKLYADKTKLKNVEGKEAEFMHAKELLNALYGMGVTDICRDIIIYDGVEWKEPVKPDIMKELRKYNNGFGRVTSYPWGVWVTAYARRNLFTGICECAGDYIYSDTDSIKIRNAEKHAEYIKKYNDLVLKKLQIAMDYHGLAFDLIKPKTIKGIEKPLGVWDLDGKYIRFKSLGAKRYMVQYETGEVNITVSGLNKQVCVPYICNGWYYDLQQNEYNSPFEKFSENLYVPPQYTGKLTHSYIDCLQQGEITDYKGLTAKYFERSSVHLESAEYSLSLAQEYADYIKQVKERELY